MEQQTEQDELLFALKGPDGKYSPPMPWEELQELLAEYAARFSATEICVVNAIPIGPLKVEVKVDWDAARSELKRLAGGHELNGSGVSVETPEPGPVREESGGGEPIPRRAKKKKP